MNKIQIVILAAGAGKRMGNDDLPKVLIPFRGKPLVQNLLDEIKKSEVCSKPLIIVGQKAEMVKEALGPDYTYVFQVEQLGTGHAVACTQEALEGKVQDIMVLNGDHPLVTAEMIQNLANKHIEQNAVITMGVVKVPDFNDWKKSLYDYGRVIRDDDGKLVKIIEKNDASPEQLEIKEVNPNYFCFKTDWLWKNVTNLNNNNAASEYYLTDFLEMACQQGQDIITVDIKSKEALGVNTAEQLNLVGSLITE